MSRDETSLPSPYSLPPTPPPGAEPGVRPVTASIRRRAVSLTPPQSDAISRLLVPGGCRLVELFSLQNGTLGATLRGAGYAARRIYITAEGRVAENQEASEPDPLGEATDPFVLARDQDRLHLGTMSPGTGAAQVREPKLRGPSELVP